MFLSTAYNNAKRWIANKTSIVIKLFVSLLVLAVVIGCITFPTLTPFVAIAQSVGMPAIYATGIVSLVCSIIYGEIVVDCTVGDSSSRVTEIRKAIKEIRSNRSLSPQEKEEKINELLLIRNPDGSTSSPTDDPVLEAGIGVGNKVGDVISKTSESILGSIARIIVGPLLPIAVAGFVIFSLKD